MRLKVKIALAFFRASARSVGEVAREVEMASKAVLEGWESGGDGGGQWGGMRGRGGGVKRVKGGRRVGMEREERMGCTPSLRDMMAMAVLLVREWGWRGSLYTVGELDVELARQYVGVTECQ